MASIRGAILLAALLRRASACDTTKLAACDAAAKMIVGDAANKDKVINCAAQDTFEKCYLANAYDCTATVKTAWKEAVETSRNSLYGDKGIECSGALSTTMPLMSGDSGMTSGSYPHASSNSTYGWLAWQAIMLVCCICCCCAAAGGAAAYYMGPGKKKRAAKAKRDYDYPLPESMPLAEAAVDVNGDGQIDAIVVGEDKNRDGIPDVLQGDDKAAAEVIPVQEPVPPMLAVQEPMLEATPNLFGPPPMLLPQAQSAYTTTAAYPQYTGATYAAASYPAATYAAPSYPATSYAGGYGGYPTTSYAQPTYGYAGGAVV